MTYEEFEEEIHMLTGLNLVFYKEKQMRKRIDTMIERLGMEGYEDYLHFLLDSKENLQYYFLQYITINVTEFFRTPDHWKYVEDHALLFLPDDATIWSCACSSGQEAYSLAISLAEQHKLENTRIIATDIDDKVLGIATRGEYALPSMEGLSEDIIAKYFTQTKNGYRISDEIHNHVEFRKINLLADIFPPNCDMIVCRNVLIYFTDEAKYKLYQRFSRNLSPNGYLFTGHTEHILNYKDYGLKKVKSFLYQKKED